MLGTLFFLLAVVVVVGAWVMRRRVRDSVHGERPMTGDPLLDELLADSDTNPETWEQGEPLDEDRAREAEDRFWEEDWDHPEEWRS